VLELAVSAWGRPRWLQWLLRWLGWRKREPGNAASEAIETEPNTGGERPVEAICQAPAADDPMPPPTSEEPGGSQGGGGEDRRPSKPPKNRRERGRNARSGGDSGGGEAVAVGGTSQPEERLQVSESRRNVPKSHQCKTCLRPDVEIINAKRRKGQTLRLISFEHGIDDFTCAPL
jgi:hypothetical protein